MKPKLSIIILNYNTKKLLEDCLNSLWNVKNELSHEVIVVDNASTDESVDMIKKHFGWVRLIENHENSGFSAGNNLAKNVAKGDYVLFLNSDTIVNQKTLKKSVEYMDKHSDVGAMTCKIVLPNGELDRDARRSFPTPWVAFSHFVYLDRLFPKSSLFSKYWYGYISADEEHEVDVLQGAFFLSRKNILDDVGWFDETYFLNGEDIDLSWKIKNKGWKIIYYPRASIVHIKKGTKKSNRKLKNETSGVKAMEIFYRTRMWDRYPLVVNLLVIGGIQVMRAIRSIFHYIKQ